MKRNEGKNVSNSFLPFVFLWKTVRMLGKQISSEQRKGSRNHYVFRQDWGEVPWVWLFATPLLNNWENLPRFKLYFFLIYMSWENKTCTLVPYSNHKSIKCIQQYVVGIDRTHVHAWCSPKQMKSYLMHPINMVWSSQVQVHMTCTGPCKTCQDAQQT